MVAIRLLPAGLLLLLVACGSPQERAAKHLASAQALYAEGDYVKAKLDAQNAAQIEPKNAEARLLLAKLAEKEQDYRAAVGHLLVAVDADPNNVAARTRLGLYYFLGKAAENAREQADAALALAPDDAEVRLLNARVKYLEGDPDASLEQAKLALSLDESNADAVMFLSGLYADRKQMDEAFEVIRAGRERITGDEVEPLRQFELQLLSQAGRLEDVEAGLVALTRDYPDKDAYKYALAQFYNQQNRPADAEGVIRDLIALDPSDPERKINLVRLLVQQERVDEAEQALRSYVEASPADSQLRLALGAFYESRSQPENAREEYRLIAKSEPTSEQGIAARNRLVALAIRDGQLDQARVLAAAILDDVPDDPDALLTRAAFAFLDGDNDAAISDLRIVLRQEEDSERAMLLLARAYVRKGDAVLAQDTYRRLLAINPKHPDAPKELAVLLANQGDINQAQDVLQARLEVEPEDTAAALGLIQAMLAEQQFESAEAEARKLVELNQDNALAQLQLGRVLQARGSPDEAIAAYKATLEDDPKATAALQGLASVLVQNDRAGEAESYLLDYLEQHPEVMEARFLLAAVYGRQGRREDAIAEFNTVIDARPDATRAYLALAALYPSDSAEREAVYRRGLEAMPADPQLSLMLASQYERQQRMDDAIELYEGLLAKNPDNLVAINNLASLLLDFRDDQASFERALELAKKLQNVEQPPFLDTIGWAYYRTADYYNAVRYLERAVAGAGTVPILRYHLGMAYAANNNSVGARQELEKALEQARSDFVGIETARQKLAELEAG